MDLIMAAPAAVVMLAQALTKGTHNALRTLQLSSRHSQEPSGGAYLPRLPPAHPNQPAHGHLLRGHKIMAMTRSGYQMLALDFGRAYAEATQPETREVLDSLMRDVMESLKADNNRFDYGKFKEAVEHHARQEI